MNDLETLLTLKHNHTFNCQLCGQRAAEAEYADLGMLCKPCELSQRFRNNEQMFLEGIEKLKKLILKQHQEHLEELSYWLRYAAGLEKENFELKHKLLKGGDLNVK